MSSFDRVLGYETQHDQTPEMPNPEDSGAGQTMPNPEGGDSDLNLPGQGLDPSPIHSHGDDSALHGVDPSPDDYPLGNDVQLPDAGLDPSPVHPHGGDLNLPDAGLDPSPIHPHGGDDWSSSLQSVDPDPNFGSGLYLPYNELDPSPIHSHGGNGSLPGDGLDPSPVHSHGDWSPPVDGLDLSLNGGIGGQEVDPPMVPLWSDNPLDQMQGSLPIPQGIVKVTVAEMTGSGHPDGSDANGSGASGAAGVSTAAALDPAEGKFGGSATPGADHGNSNDDGGALGAGHIGTLESSSDQALVADLHNPGSDNGIIVIGGHDALGADAASFWNQAAEATQGLLRGTGDHPAGSNEASVLQNSAMPHGVLDALESGRSVATPDSPGGPDGFEHHAVAERAVIHDAGQTEPALDLHDMLSLTGGSMVHQLHL